ncbi:MAG: helix-turn-helix domain-containing protein [Planctomycetes bacterium]|nr:helix-turn-helix domain-containing protein [Planctomycetota bacterium]
MQDTRFMRTQTILCALKFTLAKGGFGKDAKQSRTAKALIKQMESTKSVSGRHLQLTALLKKGASIKQMTQSTGASRRTVFRYLNHFEEAGIDLILEDGIYRFK